MLKQLVIERSEHHLPITVHSLAGTGAQRKTLRHANNKEGRMVQLFAISTILLAFSIIGLDYWFRTCNAVGPMRAWQLLRHDRTP
jgi:hypothetical protein